MKKQRGSKRSKSAVFLQAGAVAFTLAALLLIPGLARHGADASRQQSLQQTEIADPSELNGDYFCDLVIPGSDIRFPVVRGSDNQKYLHTSFIGEENILGAIFMDYRCGEASAPHTIIYGHDARAYDGSRLMFGVLRNYLDEAFIAAHPEIELVRNDTAKRFRLFAVKVTDTGDDAYCLDFGAGGRSFEEFAELMGAPANTKEILTLSTCLGGDGNLRLLVQGALTEE